MSTRLADLLEQASALYRTHGPWLITELHLIASALFPIYAGAHASLSRPISAAKATKKRARGAHKDDDDGGNKMEGLSPLDAIYFPILAGFMLTGLYYLIKWLQDPAILNRIVNGYISIFGMISIAQFLTDGMNVGFSFMFPSRYRRQGIVWEARPQRRSYKALVTADRNTKEGDSNPSPWPGVLSKIATPRFVDDLAWKVQRSIARPLYILDFYLRGTVEASIAVGPLRTLNNVVAISLVIYYNFVSKPWWLTNLYGFSMTYGSMQLMSPTTFWTGTLILSSLFFYDIYFVFFTSVMLTVATKLDAPIKLLIPRPADEQDDPTKLAVSMIGLGDIVVPGMMIGLALRFDLYMFYLKRQRHTETKKKRTTLDIAKDASKKGGQISNARGDLVYDESGTGRAQYERASGNWGERFWLGAPAAGETQGYRFPKPYFYASVFGYTAGLLVTWAIMQIFQHGQPALLYLVPGVLGSLWLTALARGEIGHMWNYSEMQEDDTNKANVKPASTGEAVKGGLSKPQKVVKRQSIGGGQRADSSGDEISVPTPEEEDPAHKPHTKNQIRDGELAASSTSGEADTVPEYDDILPPFASYESLPISRPEGSIFTMSIRLIPGRTKASEVESGRTTDLKSNRETAGSPRPAEAGRKDHMSNHTDRTHISDAEAQAADIEEVPLEATPARNTRARRAKREHQRRPLSS